MALYLLDADAVIDYLKSFPPTVGLIRELSARGDLLCTCEVVLAEIYSGLSLETAPVLEFLDSLLFLPGSLKAAVQAGRWRLRSAGQGRPLRTTDVLIAATAQAHGATLVTGNVRDYPMPEVSLLLLPR